MRTKVLLCLLLPGLILALPRAAWAEGLRTTGNAIAITIVDPDTNPDGVIPYQPYIERWAPHSMCVDLRASNLECDIFNDPEEKCRTVPSDATLAALFFNTIQAAENINPSITIGTYLSGARVQEIWRDWPIEALDKAVFTEHEDFEPDWIQQPGGPGTTEYIDITLEAARDAFAEAIIAEQATRNRPILYLDNIVHPAKHGDNDYPWADRMELLSTVKEAVNANGQQVFANVALASHLFSGNYDCCQACCPDCPEKCPASHLTDLTASVDGVSFEQPFHLNARTSQEGIEDTIDVHRAILDAGLTLIFIPLCEDCPPPSDPNHELKKAAERRLIAGFAMCIRNANEPLFVAQPFTQSAADWDVWPTQWGPPLEPAEVHAGSPLTITRAFANGTLTINVATKDVTFAPVAPTIFVQWDGTDPQNPDPEFQPIEFQHYEIVATDSDYPNLILRSGRDDWRIWSRDATDPDRVTNIGTISTPAPENFTVKLLRPDDTAGARHVKGITLVPEAPCVGQGNPFSCCTGSGTGSCGNTNIAGGTIAGDLGSDGLVLKNSGGQVGAASFTIDGDVSGNITIPRVEFLQVHGAVNAGSTITIDEFAENGTFTVDGVMSGEIDICDGNPGAPVQLPDNLHLASIDSQGTVCETHVCGATAPLFNDASGHVRSISFRMADSAQGAIAINLTSLHRVSPPYTGGPSVPFEAFEGQTVYVGPPNVYREWFSGGTRFVASRTQCEPSYRDWSSFRSCNVVTQICEDNGDCPTNFGNCSDTVDPLLHVFGSAICPSSQYEVQLMPGANAACAGSLTLSTNRWGDVESPYSPDVSVQPDMVDISSLVTKFRTPSAQGAPIKARAFLQSNDAFGNITDLALALDFSFIHISACVDAFRGQAYQAKMGRCSGLATMACTMDSDCIGSNTPPCVLNCQ